MRAQTVQCMLCPKQCKIPEGRSGDCRIRINIGGKLRAVTFGFPVAVHVDPVEKKPFFHYFPSTPILSVATVGCNMHCKNCQNWEISQANPEDQEAYDLPPKALVQAALSRNIPLIAYTYTEPIVYYEYTYESALLGKQQGLRSAIVSAGYANPEPMRALFKVVEAATIDVKCFDEQFYRDICDGGLKPVLNTLVIAKEENAWLEVSNLVIPTLSDDRQKIAMLVRWVKQNLGDETPLHFLRFVPHHKLKNLPPTPVETLEDAWKLALDAGMKYVYIGNVPGHEAENTRCPSCGKVVIGRVGYRITEMHLKKNLCEFCGAKIAGVFRGAT